MGATGAKVQLHQGEVPLADDYVRLEPGQSKRLLFRVEARTSSQLRAQLLPDGPDVLESDNTAYLDLPAGRPLALGPARPRPVKGPRRDGR